MTSEAIARESTALAWALAETAGWRNKPIDFNEAHFHYLNNVSHAIFVYRISPEGVTRLHKPMYPNGSVNAFTARAHIYENFLNETLRHRLACEPFLLALDVADEPPEWNHLPVFAFQKRSGSSSLLLPEGDCVGTDFYKGWPLPDRIPYHKKTITAVFVGSTSGGGAIRTNTIDRVPRIKAARYFRDIDCVDFRLPSLVMLDDPDVEDALRSEGFGGPHVPWEDQLRSLFLITLDGNGAACSRLYMALASNGVPLKYASDSVLHYFRSLKPDIHYVPIEKHSDVLNVIFREFQTPGAYNNIAENGKTFVQDFLNRNITTEYCYHIVNEYYCLMQDNAVNMTS